MPIALMTQSAFLRRQFTRTRRSLLGQPVLRKIRKTAPELLVSTNLSPKPPEIAIPPIRPVSTPQNQVNEHFQARLQSAQSRAQHSDASEHAGSWLKSAARFALTLIMVVCFSVLAAVILPDLYYRVFSSTPTAYEEVSQAARDQERPVTEVVEEVEEPYLPEFNPNLPEGHWISIPRIGVYTQMQATQNPDDALDTGVWLVPDFGRPGDQELPIIAAAHRFGWDWWWQSDYWKYNSFYLLTETEPGDRVEIIYDQRKWVYEIYAGEEGALITDYDADLILYTCKHLRSPIRHFRYARVVEV